MAGNLGPKPRVNLQGGPGPADGFPSFYAPPSGPMQPDGLGPPVQSPVQPPTQPVQSVQQPFPNTGSGFGQPPPAGSIGTMQPGSGFGQPQRSSSFPGPGPATYDDDFENEPPLLEELGINVDNIVMRMKGVAFFKQVPEETLTDLDLSGPVSIICVMVTCLLFSGKIVGGYVYGFFMMGSIFLWMLLNVMSQKDGIDLYRTVSILGYGLIPMIIIAFVGIFVKLTATFGILLSSACVLWSTFAASRFFATANSMVNQRWLVAYPVLLFYMCFMLITVF